MQIHMPTWGHTAERQNLNLFKVEDNIALGVPPAQIDRTAAESAARLAGVHDFVAGLPEGYATQAGERGARLGHHAEAFIAGISLHVAERELAAVGRRLVAIAGTHGKSTTTGWLVHLLAAAGRDPSAFVGALMPPALTGGIAATAIGAWLGEKWRKGGVGGAYFLVSAAGAAFAVPCFIALLYTPLPLSWLFVVLAIFGLFLYTGPGNTILANVVSSDVRGTAFAINVLVIHALGDVISPPLIGAVADATSLQTAFALTTAMIALGAVLWFWGIRYLDEDTANAEASATASGTAT